MNKLTIALSALGFCCLVNAGTRIDEARPLDADGVISIVNVKGEVKVSAWDRQEVEIRGELGDGTKALEISDGGSRLSIEVKLPRNARNVERTDLEIQAPRGASLRIEVVSADVKVDGIDGREIDIEAVSGDVGLEGSPEQLEINLVSGDVEVEGRTSQLDIEAVSGDIRIEGATGEIRVNTVSGLIDLEAQSVSDAEFETVSGDLELNFDFAPRGRLKAESVSGDVELNVVGLPSVDVSVSSFSGSIRSDVGSVRKAKHGPNQSLSYRSSDSDADIDVESFSGDVKVREK